MKLYLDENDHETAQRDLRMNAAQSRLFVEINAISECPSMAAVSYSPSGLCALKKILG